MDQDGSGRGLVYQLELIPLLGSIGVDELTDPLISLGIAETVEEVQKIVDSVDDDQSGQIEFREFLQIIGGAQEDKGDTGIIDFFKGEDH